MLPPALPGILAIAYNAMNAWRGLAFELPASYAPGWGLLALLSAGIAHPGGLPVQLHKTAARVPILVALLAGSLRIRSSLPV
jgi:hypothetical protein